MPCYYGILHIDYYVFVYKLSLHSFHKLKLHKDQGYNFFNWYNVTYSRVCVKLGLENLIDFEFQLCNVKRVCFIKQFSKDIKKCL